MPPREDWPGRAPVTAADVKLAVRLAVVALGRAPAEAWGNQAGSLEWDCWETVEHIADDLFAYATQLTPATPEGSYVPIAMTSTRPGGAESAIHVDREKGTAGLLQALEACGALLAALAVVQGSSEFDLTTCSPHPRRVARSGVGPSGPWYRIKLVTGLGGAAAVSLPPEPGPTCAGPTWPRNDGVDNSGRDQGA